MFQDWNLAWTSAWHHMFFWLIRPGYVQGIVFFSMSSDASRMNPGWINSPFLPKSHCFCWFCPLNYNIHPSLLCYSVCNYDMLLSWTLRHQACWILLVYPHNSPASLLSILRVRHSRTSLANPCGFTQRVAGSTAGVTCKNSGVSLAVFKKRIDMDWRFIWQSTWNHLKYIIYYI